MKKLLLSTTALLYINAGALHAQSIADQVISQLQERGYQSIEVVNGPTQIKVEGILDGRKLEVIYDAVTGAIISEEVVPVDSTDGGKSGVSIQDDSNDFVDEDGNEIEDGSDDNDGDSDSNDDSGDDDSGDDSGDDDSGDDDSDDDSGDDDSDDDSGDDESDDDSGDDDGEDD